MSSKYPNATLHFVYEAGPCGYWIYRLLTKLGHEFYVVLPAIIAKQNGQITFRYRDNKQQNQTRTLNANDFLKLVLQHVLPKGFRRVRDYGYLHGNAKQTLKRVQWALQVDHQRSSNANNQVGIANSAGARCTSSAPTDDGFIVANRPHRQTLKSP